VHFDASTSDSRVHGNRRATHAQKSQQTHVEEGVDERPREALLEAHHRRLQLPAWHPTSTSASRSSSGTAKLGASVAEVVGDGAAGGEPLRPSVVPDPGRRGGGRDGAQPEGAAPAARAVRAEGRGERGGRRRSRREHR